MNLVVNTMWAFMAALGVSRHTRNCQFVICCRTASTKPMTLTMLTLMPCSAPSLIVPEYICRSTGIRDSRLRLYPDQR